MNSEVITQDDLTAILNEVLPVQSPMVRISQAPNSISVSPSTPTAVCSISLEPGTWILFASFRAPSNATGYRIANLETSAGYNSCNYCVPAVNGNVTQGAFTKIVQLTSTTTYYLNVYHTSSAALTYPSGSTNYIQAIKIA